MLITHFLHSALHCVCSPRFTSLTTSLIRFLTSTFAFMFSSIFSKASSMAISTSLAGRLRWRGFFGVRPFEIGVPCSSTSPRFLLNHFETGVYGISWTVHLVNATPISQNFWPCRAIRFYQSTLIRNTCSAYIIFATDLGVALLGHRSKSEILLSIVKISILPPRLQDVRNSHLWTCNVARDKVLATTYQSEGSPRTAL